MYQAFALVRHMRPAHTVTTMVMKLLVCASFTVFIANCILLAHYYQVVNNFVSKNMYLNDSEL